MGKKLQDPEDRISQRSIGFTYRQFSFLNKYPDFRPDSYCREALDQQIAQIDPQFLKENEKTTDNSRA